jgi:hypothetical protein
MTAEQRATVRWLFVHRNLRAAAIADRLGVPLKDVEHFIAWGDGPIEDEREPLVKPERVSAATIARLENLVAGLTLTRRRRPRGPMSEATRQKIRASVLATQARSRALSPKITPLQPVPVVGFEESGR